MNKITDQATKSSLGTYFVDLFEVDTDQFQIGAQPRHDRTADFLNRPYELSDLMRQAMAAGVWPRQQ